MGLVADRADSVSGTALAGSQLQTQLYVTKRRRDLDDAIRASVKELSSATFEWRSPLLFARYAE